MRDRIRAEVAGINPLDALELAHQHAALTWIDSGAALCRKMKPATPPIHLVSYFAVVRRSKLLLVDHLKARLWLPTGGHVEDGEHPRKTVERELAEELGMEAPHPIAAPLMITITQTVGLTAGHTDISLWYVVRMGDSQNIAFDGSEFSAIGWFDAKDLPYDRTDPHMRRFMAKLSAATFLPAI